MTIHIPMPESKLEIAREVTGFVAGASVAFVVSSLITAYTPTETTTQKVKVFVGSFVAASAARQASTRWALGQFDRTVDFVRVLKHKVQEKQYA